MLKKAQVSIFLNNKVGNAFMKSGVTDEPTQVRETQKQIKPRALSTLGKHFIGIPIFFGAAATLEQLPNCNAFLGASL